MRVPGPRDGTQLAYWTPAECVAATDTALPPDYQALSKRASADLPSASKLILRLGYWTPAKCVELQTRLASRLAGTEEERQRRSPGGQQAGTPHWVLDARRVSSATDAASPPEWQALSKRASPDALAASKLILRMGDWMPAKSVELQTRPCL